MHIYYHDDFDGVVSAAILAGSLKQVMGVASDFESANYHLKPRWRFDDPIREGDYAIVDFLFHPGAAIWFDHHGTTFVEQAYADAFSDNQTSTKGTRPIWVWDAKAPSCGKLVYNKLCADVEPLHKQFNQLAEFADLVDSVQYDSPEACYDLTHPATALNHAHRYLTEGGKTSLIQALMTGDVEAGLSTASAAVEEAQVKVPQALTTYSKLYARHGNVAFVSTLGERVPLMRFAPFIDCPTALYGVVLYGGGNGTVRVSVTKNPWLDFTHVDLSEIMVRFGGGGHPKAAAANFEAPELAVTQGWGCVRQVIQALNRQ